MVPVTVLVDAVLGLPIKDRGGSLPLKLLRGVAVLVVEVPLVATTTVSRLGSISSNLFASKN